MTLDAGENVRVVKAISLPAIVQRRNDSSNDEAVLLCYFFAEKTERKMQNEKTKIQ